ncbi:dynein axonemal intermediate chain 2-like [Bicyclus anynana]|uniref:Dynein axonemal intermediate chain 2-like n=1 Tax=Bicyclus anynana TaxID=110368 RepID=A0A6J1N7K7_BICAN|nr:dynein axonemal intermediate chain 2-like [Bicyclus anynana]
MELVNAYTKKRSSFGRQPLFCEQGPALCDSVPSDPAAQRGYVLRNPVHQPVQHGPRTSAHTVNTARAEYTTTGSNHAEGGWPKDVNVLDPEATQRYRRKIEKDENYIHCAMSLSPGMDHYVMQNNAIDMYQTYYTELAAQPPLERCSVRTVNVYRDPLAGGGGGGGGRPVSSVAWTPDGAGFAVAYAAMDAHLAPRAPLDAFVWDAESAARPAQTLRPPATLLDLQCSPRDVHVLAGGLASGQVAVWDRRRGAAPAGASPPHAAHRELVRGVLFVNSKSGREFFSGGPDGVCKWWDMRDLSAPTDEMIVDVVHSSFEAQSRARALGVSVLEYEPTIPTRFMVGTENGLVVGGNRKGKTPTEKLPAQFEAHFGPVRSLERNPSFLKNFLTVGDWTVRVFSEDCRESAVLWSPPQRRRVTAAAWSPTRLSLLLALQADGRLAAWDLLRRQHEPALAVRVSVEPLLRIKMHDGGALAACGSGAGHVYMVELAQSLVQSDKNDKALLTAVLERESRRERVLEARARELRLKLRQAEEGSAAASEEPPDERALADAAAEYAALVRRELAAL